MLAWRRPPPPAAWQVLNGDGPTDRRNSSRGGEDESAVRALAFDGGGLLATADGGCVRLWSMERRKKICSLKSHSGRAELHPGGVTCLSIATEQYGGDGGGATQLLSGGADGALCLYDLEELSKTASLRGHAAPISDCALLTDLAAHADARAAAASTSVDGTIKLWDATGSHLSTLQPALPHDVPAAPVPMAVRGTTLLCGRGYELMAHDLQAERPVARLPLPVQHPPLHVAASDLERSHLIALSCLQASSVFLFDPRLLPATDAAADADADADAPLAPPQLWDELPSASRRALVGTLQLPTGVACARQLHVDAHTLLLSLDTDWLASAFSRTAHGLALYDMRAAGSAPFRASPPPPLWQREVRGELSCFLCGSDERRIFVGTAHGAVLLWGFGGGAPVEEDDDDEGAGKAPKREKWRAKKKVRGKYPKTQGFSNNKF